MRFTKEMPYVVKSDNYKVSMTVPLSTGFRCMIHTQLYYVCVCVCVCVCVRVCVLRILSCTCSVMLL